MVSGHGKSHLPDTSPVYASGWAAEAATGYGHVDTRVGTVDGRMLGIPVANHVSGEARLATQNTNQQSFVLS